MTTDMTPPSASIFLLALAAWCTLLKAPVLSHAVDDQPRRFQSIDGLRGLLAIAVFSHHFALTAQWQRTGLWATTKSPLWNAMGHVSVSLFFMITGFLFFRKIGPATSRFDFIAFAKGRVTRIYPVYLVCLCMTAALALGLQDQPVHFVDAAKSVALWLLFCPGRLLGMQDAGLIVAYAPWSLRYELCFYAALPVLAWAWRRLAYHPAFLIILGFASILLSHKPLEFEHGSLQLDSRYLAPFILGGVTTLFVPNERHFRRFGREAGSFVAISAILAICFRGDPYSLKSYLVLFVAFVPIAAGASLFGLLTSRAMLMLGAVSYDIYILHGLVLFIIFHILAPTVLIGAAAPVFLLALIVVGAAVIAISILVHKLVEKPAATISLRRRRMEAGERLAV